MFDPATRTAEMEIEIPNGSFRLKPGMYARVQLTVDSRANALTVPRNALVELDGKPGVFIASTGGGNHRAGRARADGQGRRRDRTQGGTGQGQGSPAMTAKFLPVQTGIRDGEHIEITAGSRTARASSRPARVRSRTATASSPRPRKTVAAAVKAPASAPIVKDRT